MTSGKLDVYSRKTSEMENQLFKIEYNEKTGYYKITNPTSGLALDVTSAGVKSETPIVAWTQHEGCNQSWVIKPDGVGYYTVASKCSDKVLDATSANKLIIYGKHGGDNQKWQLVRQ